MQKEKGTIFRSFPFLFYLKLSLRHKSTRNRHIAARPEADDCRPGRCPLDIPCIQRGTKYCRVEFTVAVIIARNCKIAGCSERNRVKGRIFAPEDKPISV